MKLPILLLLALALNTATAHGMGSFTPQHFGARLVDVKVSQSALLECSALALNIAPACADFRSWPYACTIILPSGASLVVAVIGALASPDEVIGHEGRHCWDGDYHSALLHGIEK